MDHLLSMEIFYRKNNRMKPSGLAHLCEKVSIKKLRTILLGFERSFSQIIEPFNWFSDFVL